MSCRSTQPNIRRDVLGRTQSVLPAPRESVSELLLARPRHVKPAALLAGPGVSLSEWLAPLLPVGVLAGLPRRRVSVRPQVNWFRLNK